MYEDKVNTKFQSKTIPKENSVIRANTKNSVIRANKKYNPQTLLEECKYEIKKNKF